ncbi:UNVERIFIED_CONTAM: hypothetical protein GTU68_025949 [Idotea baltica]|nr:hypothetical protein [Idotea baltica]
MLVGYIYIYDHLRLFEFEENIWTWVALFVGIDFFYYWFHRLAHEISFFWGTHIVHHQSEEYNLSVALRQSAFQTLYQFWIHTKAIGKMPGWFEFVFNTPSHHRVHHGRNPKYIDKNHGGTLIIFDRMFGTFQAEEEEVIYGVTKPLASFNPVWANLDYYADFWKDLQLPMKWRDRLRLFYKKPGWLPEYLGGYRAPKEMSPDATLKYDIGIPLGLNYYILFQYLIILIIASGFLFNLDAFNRIEQLMIGGVIILSIASIGGLFDGRRWAVIIEVFRWGLLVTLGIALVPELRSGLFMLAVVGVISVIWMGKYRNAFGS